jgi:hypothetical protein
VQAFLYIHRVLQLLRQEMRSAAWLVVEVLFAVVLAAVVQSAVVLSAVVLSAVVRCAVAQLAVVERGSAQFRICCKKRHHPDFLLRIWYRT